MYELPDAEFDEEEYRRLIHKQYKYGEVSLGLVINQDAYNLPLCKRVCRAKDMKVFGLAIRNCGSVISTIRWENI